MNRLTSLLAAALVLALAPLALADPPEPLGTCPTGFELRYDPETESTTEPPNFARSMNGDGYLCFKIKGNPFWGDNFYIDNDIPPRK